MIATSSQVLRARKIHLDESLQKVKVEMKAVLRSKNILGKNLLRISGKQLRSKRFY